MHGSRTAIFGGGGTTGLAWEIGVIVGLRDGGIDLSTETDVVFGTSAGAFAATIVAHRADLDERYKMQLEDDGTEVPATMSDDLREKYASLAREHHGLSASLARALGDLARGSQTIDPSVRNAVIGSRLRLDAWPNADSLRITALDADTGELVVLGRQSGLTLTQAVGASSAVPGIWPMVIAGGRNWIDGGLISPVNAHLGEGFEHVLVVAPVGGVGGGFGELEIAVERLRALGTRAIAVIPDTASRNALGGNAFDPTRRARSAQAGRRQGRRVAEQVLATWRD